MRLKKRFLRSLLAILAIYIIIGMIINPQETYNGASYGVKTWVGILIPSLLPFFIISSLLVELGIVSLIGALLDNFMRPVFKEPGEAGFVLAMGFTSGFPMGAVLTNELYEKNICTEGEASRLISFTNNSSPLFLLVAVPIGMFHNPTLGLILALSHYGANVILGIILGIFSKKENTNSIFQNEGTLRKIRSSIIQIADNTKSIGTLLGNAVSKSINNILSIGGFVIFFSVILEILKATKLYLIFTLALEKILILFNFDPSLSHSLATGFFEMTLGAKKASEINAPLIQQAMMVSLILGWSGLSIQAQVTSIAGKMNVPVKKYILGRFFQGLVACILTGLLFSPITKLSQSNLPAFNPNYTQISIHSFNYLKFTSLSFCIVLLFLLFASFIITIIKRSKQA